MRSHSINASIGEDGALALLKKESERWGMLTREEEIELGRRLRDHSDQKARDRLVASHIRLVMKMGARMMGYGLPYGDLVAQGMIGLLRAVDRFEPEQENRFSTYAMWWIRAEMTDYVLNNWSMVRSATTAGKKTLFFKLRRTKARLGITTEGDMSREQTEAVAEATGTSVEEVTQMNRRIGMGGDASLNVTTTSSDGESGNDWIEQLESTDPSPYEEAAESSTRAFQRMHVEAAMRQLNDRERHIVSARHLGDETSTLEELGQIYGVTRERIRQVEAKALEKIRVHIARLQLTMGMRVLSA